MRAANLRRIRLPRMSRVAIGALVCTAWPLLAGAQSSLKGTTVNMIVAGGIGGGVDVHARTLAAHFGRHLPGNPPIVISNLPGAGGLQAAQRLYNAARNDGTAFGLFNPGPITEAFLGKGKSHYDLSKFEWVGSLTRSTSNCMVWHASSVKTIHDAMSKEVTFSVTGADSGAAKLAKLYNGVLGTKFKLIAGYPGGADTLLAMERREVEGTCMSMSSLRSMRSDWLQQKKLRMLVQTAYKRDPDYPDVPTVFDFLKTELDRQAFEFMIIPYEMQNPVALPPGVSPDVIAIYRKAFDATVADPIFRADADKRQQVIEARDGLAVKAMITKLYSLSPAVLEKVISATETR